MAEYDTPQRDWLQPNDSIAIAPPPPRVQLGYDLRPLSTGEILDRTFTLYRSRFWLYAGLSSIGAFVSVLNGIARIAFLRPTIGTRNLLTGYAISLVGGLVAFAAYSVCHAATTSAVSAIYLGQDTSIGAALRSVTSRWFRYSLIAFWQTWSMIWIFFLLIVPAILPWAFGIRSLVWLTGLLFFFAFSSLIYGLIAYLRNSLAVPASVIEDLPVRKAMRRSKNLTPGTKGRIFLLLLLLGALYMVAATIQFPLALITLQVRSTAHVATQAITLLITFLTGSLVGPVAAIALCLFYFDQRVRMEAFDIEILMERTAPAGPVPASAELA
jgi:hypothetical protein